MIVPKLDDRKEEENAFFFSGSYKWITTLHRKLPSRTESFRDDNML
jgi:hypothetical protein